MKIQTKREFVSALVAAHPEYSEHGAELVYGQFEKADSDVSQAIRCWIASGTEPALSAEGWSVKRLEKEFGMNALAALLTIDWLRKDPEAAKAMLKEGIK